MRIIKLDPKEYPIERGESWWIAHPNDAGCEFKLPVGGVTVCTMSFLSFVRGTVYSIVSDDHDRGWVTMASTEDIVEMPYYVFKRYFDAEAFIRLRPKKKFNPQGILPKKIRFQDDN